MFTEQAVVHASQSLTSLILNTNTSQSSNQNIIQQNHYQQSKQNQDRYNFCYHQHHHHSPHQLFASHSNAQHQLQHYKNKQIHTLPSSLPTSIESSTSRRNFIIEHCSCGLTFKVDKNTNNIITSSTSLLTLNTIYNENPTLNDQTNNQGSLTQSQNILQEDAKHHHSRQQSQQQHETINKYNHHQHHAHHCHHYQSPSSTATSIANSASVIIPRYKPSEPPEIHTHEYFSQESQAHTATITNTTACSTSASVNAITIPRSYSCRHSHVHAQTDFPYDQR